MIVLLKNNKIIGADNQLLNLLNSDLYTLSTKISELDIIISSAKKDILSIENNQFKIKEIPLISLENIKAFDLEILSESKTELPSEDLMQIEPLNIEEPFPKLKIEEEFKDENIEPVFEEQNIIPNEAQQNIPFPEPQTLYENKKETKKQEIKPLIEEEEIKISFDFANNEINEILSSDKKAAVDLISKELKKASEDLGIDINTINELYTELIKQIKNEKENFYDALKKEDYQQLHKIAHKLKGAALNLRLSKLALILKNIDEDSKSKKPIEEIEFLIDNFYNFINKISEENKQTKIPENMKNLILLTIKEYLETQNEKKFKKDLKYIEKLLNKKINNLEDLQQLIKEE